VSGRTTGPAGVAIGPRVRLRLGAAGRHLAETAPPESFFVISALFHYLGPAFAVLLFAHVAPLGVAWLRIASAAGIFAAWRRPRRTLRTADRETRRLLLGWGVVLALMNSAFYLAIDRLPLGTVAAIEFVPVIGLAAFGVRSVRNLAALALAVVGVALLTHMRLSGGWVGFGLAFANAGLFAGYIVLGHRVARRGASPGIDGLAAAMLIALVVQSPIGGWAAVPALLHPGLLLAGIGVGICSSLIPYVTDQLAMARLARSTYALLVALLPAMATVVGVIVLAQIPRPLEAAGVALVVGGIALHRQRPGDRDLRSEGG
jgi:inner membrane transporter RhtA